MTPAYAEIRDPDFTHFDLAAYAYLVDHGMWCRDRGVAVPRGRPGVCFNNSFNLLFVHHGLKYMEGLAQQDVSGRWLHHGWCVDAQGTVYDPTWATGGQGRYFGVAIDVLSPVRLAIPNGHIPLQHGFLPCLSDLVRQPPSIFMLAWKY